jgi:phosphonate transport system permease protein
MLDVAFGPEPGRRPNLADPREAYLDLVRRKRMYGGILLVIFVALMASGWSLAEDRNAGGFLSGLHQVFAFPSEVLSEAWDKRALLPAIFWDHVPALIETLNIAAVATLIGALMAMSLVPAGHPRPRPLARSDPGVSAA